MDNNKLKSLFPRLYTISMDQGKMVGEVGSLEALGWTWRLRWRRPRFDWESSMEAELINLITRKILSKETEDTIVWSANPNGVFSVKSAYLTLCIQSNGISHDIFFSLMAS